MSREIIRTTNAPAPPRTFSQGVKAAGLVFVAGQGPFDPATGEVPGETIQEHTRQSLRNVSAILEAAGSSLANIVSATVLLVDGADFDGMNEEWLAWFPVDPPARQVTKLPVQLKGMKLSIAAIALA